MVERHRDHQTIARGQADAFTDHVAVVEDVVVAEGRAFGEPGSAGGVLDVHRLIKVQAVAAFAQLIGRDAGGQIGQLRPRQKT
ncbi:hypothetical protein D3C81_1345700 [compost metagenome]